MLSDSTSAQSTNLGFLSVFQDTGGYAGGFLVTNSWGRPLEFRLSSAVQPNKVQQILYGDTLQAHVCGEVIGKTLIEKTATPVQCVILDNPLALDVRLRIEIPVALKHAVFDPDQPPPGLLIQSQIYCHHRYPEDIAPVRAMIEKLGAFDFAEPFARIRGAMNEARRMGVATRGAA